MGNRLGTAGGLSIGASAGGRRLAVMQGMENYHMLAEVCAQAFGVDAYVVLAEQLYALEHVVRSPFCDACRQAQLRRRGQVRCGIDPGDGARKERVWREMGGHICPLGLRFAFAAFHADSECGGEYLLCGPFLCCAFFRLRQMIFLQGFGQEAERELLHRARDLPRISEKQADGMQDALYLLGSCASKGACLQLRIARESVRRSGEDAEETAAYREAAKKDYGGMEFETALWQCVCNGRRAEAQRLMSRRMQETAGLCGEEGGPLFEAGLSDYLQALGRVAAACGYMPLESFLSAQEEAGGEGRGRRGVKDLSAASSDFLRLCFKAGRSRHSDLVDEVVLFVFENYMKRITLEELAEHVNFSVSYISRVFMREIGVSVTAFINRVRIERAKGLLMNKSIPLVDIANLSGFEDQSYFSKVFRKVVGVPPGEIQGEKRILSIAAPGRRL